MDYRICTQCQIRHYENCGTCFGFGVRQEKTVDGWIPITAAQAHQDVELPDWYPCPECSSIPAGIQVKDYTKAWRVGKVLENWDVQIQDAHNG